MTRIHEPRRAEPEGRPGPDASAGLAGAAAAAGAGVLSGLDVGPAGLSPDEATRRRATWGPNAITSHRARFLLVLWHQVRSPLLALLLTAALASYFVGERSDAVFPGSRESLRADRLAA